jgi:hypothetical protein
LTPPARGVCSGAASPGRQRDARNTPKSSKPQPARDNTALAAAALTGDQSPEDLVFTLTTFCKFDPRNDGLAPILVDRATRDCLV